VIVIIEESPHSLGLTLTQLAEALRTLRPTRIIVDASGPNRMLQDDLQRLFGLPVEAMTKPSLAHQLLNPESRLYEAPPAP
jgi:hypothetical protein